MSFTLRIAAAPVPGVREAGFPEHVDAAVAATVTLEASGLMDVAGAEAMRIELQRLFAEGADTIVIDVERLETASDEVRARFIAAIRAERALTHHVYVRSAAAPLRDTLASCDDAEAWLMPAEGTTGDLPRRSFAWHSPLRP